MKIKSVFDLCKKSQRIMLFEENTSEQWVSDGNAAFLAEGFPYLTKDLLMAFFDIPETKREGWQVYHKELPSSICFEDNSPEEKIIETHNIPILHGKQILKTLHTSNGITFIDADYLKPIADIKDDIEFYERQTDTGKTDIVVKAGFMIRAIIMPFDYLNNKSIAELELFLKGCKSAYNKKENKDFFYSQGEIVRVDFQTGELLEDWED